MAKSIAKGSVGPVSVRVRPTRRGRLKLATMAAAASTTFSSDKLKERAVKRVKARYLQEVDPEGKPWQLLSPLTRKRKAIMGSSQILVDEGNLYESIGYDSKGTDSVGSNTGAGFRITAGGPKAPYARRHQIGLGFTPRRPFIGLSDADVSSMEKMIERMLAGKPVRV